VAHQQDAKLSFAPRRVLAGSPVVLRGDGWPDCPVAIAVGGKPARIERVLQGHPAPGGVRPSRGEFAVRLATYGLEPGHHDVTVTATPQVAAKTRLDVLERRRPTKEDKRGDSGLAYWRGLAGFERRFANLGYIPPGIGAAREASLGGLRRRLEPNRRRVTGRGPGGTAFFSLPMAGGSNWVPLGPAPFVAGGMALRPASSGRVLSIAVDPSLSTRIYAGTANGGVWKSTDGGLTWAAKTDDQSSLAIGALAIDPNAANRVFAGTGEFHHDDPYGAYYGRGLLYSSDFGETWTPLAAATFDSAEISRILFDPADTAHHMFLACDGGVFETITGGTMWTTMRAGAASDLVLRVLPGPSLQLIAAFHGEGIFTNTLTAGVWSGWTAIASAAFPGTFGRIALGQSRNHPDHIWAAFSADTGGLLAGIARTTNGGGIWTSVAVPPTGIWQTVYNLFIAVHPNVPDTVFLGTSHLFRTDTGDAPWTEIVGGPGSYLHADHHALEFDPNSAAIVFDGSDGGVFRSGDGGATWDQRNRGLGTIQIYQVANHPQWAALVLAGTQDNGGGFGTTTPAWPLDRWPGLSHNPIEGDIVAVAIDPLLPSRMYYVLYGDVYRSDDGGRMWTWKFTIPGPAEWNAPFAIDPSA